jgi:hypothetical protein
MELLEKVRDQLLEVTRISMAAQDSKLSRHTGTVLCICRKRIPIQNMFHCYHCGLWLCPKCSSEHFGLKNSVPAHNK